MPKKGTKPVEAKLTAAKESNKKVKPTTVKKVAKAKRPPVKATKKRKARMLPVTDEAFEKWFFKMDAQHFIEITQRWNEAKLKVTIKKQADYDAWFNYFKDIPASQLRLLSSTGQDFLGGEAYSALRRWLDIISNPHRIDKVHQTGLSNAGGPAKKKTIAQLALDNDRLGVLKATRDKLAEKLDKGAGNRDTSLLVREMTEVMTQISDYEKRLGPKKETALGKLLDDMPIAKRPSENGNGARHTSFKTRVTIEDVDG